MLEKIIPRTSGAGGDAAGCVAEKSQGGAQDEGLDHFYILGIGASAGGLAALEKFMGAVPLGCGVGFVVVQHLDPKRQGMMAELLQRSTTMPVMEAADGMRVMRENVYVIPPGHDLSILGGVLQVMPTPLGQGLRLPIDFFLTSLAQDQGELGVAVILSGMGADGTAGARAIKRHGGWVAVQAPSTAEFDSMPRSVEDAGLADLAARAEELPTRILAWLGNQVPAHPLEAGLDDQWQAGIDKVLVLLRVQTGNDFSHYKRNTILRRVQRRMGLHHLTKTADYVRYLQENPQEVSLLFKELLIGVTSFFRDPEAWVQLREKVLPLLLADRLGNREIRAWVVGCSTGEEAYSLAMILKEAASELRPRQVWSLQIFATDLEPDAIGQARAGFYRGFIAEAVGAERLERFFKAEEGGYRVRREIREMVVFAPHNLLADPPFTKLDLLLCRNVLIYLKPEAQRRLIPLFHYCLRPGGILLQGTAETVGEGTALFRPLGGRTRLFQRMDSSPSSDMGFFPPALTKGAHARTELRPAGISPNSIQALADQMVLQRYAPPAVLTNSDGDILYVSGRTGKYLEAAAGKANWNVFAMAHEGLRYELSAGFQQSLRQENAVTLPRLKVSTEGRDQWVAVTLQRLDETGPLKGLVMIVFQELLGPNVGEAGMTKRGHGIGKASILAELEQALLKARAEARMTLEEMQTSQEELRSANEELQSTNEELQSTNEELTTSKEEMQSMNEEMQAVNAELLAKVEEHSRTSNDMKNLLDSTDIATLFLDAELNVRRFTPQATKIIKLIPSDVGRPITDLVSDLIESDLARDARDVMRDLAPVEKNVGTHDGRWFTVRIMPYRTLDDHVEGVVITFANITSAKTLEGALREHQGALEKSVAEQSTELQRRRKADTS